MRTFWLVGLALACVGAGPPLRWGADPAGGAPFIYTENNQQVGFEIDLMNYLGAELGRTPELVAGDWDAMPDTLQRGNIDIAFNGYEFLPDRETEFPSSVPYYVYTLRLITRSNDSSIGGWDDLIGKRVGVLRGTVAERYLQQTYGDKIEIIPTREVDETFQLVEAGARMDATVQDSPAAYYYVQGGRRPGLHVVGDARAPGLYVALTRPADQELRQQLNVALRKALASGKLKEIYSKYGLWTAEQEALAAIHAGEWPPPPGTVPTLQLQSITLAGLSKKLAIAAGTTLALAFCAMPLAILLGLGIALGRLYGQWFVRWPLAWYVEIMRGTPLLLQLFALFFLFPQFAQWVGWSWLIALATMPPFVVGVIGLALNYAACEAEIYRAGLQAIPRGQMEAALALGMSRATALRVVVIPQAVRLVIPPVTNDFIALFKDTAVCSVILITELTGLYYQYKYDRAIALQLAGVVALIYLGMSYPLAVLARWLERPVTRTA